MAETCRREKDPPLNATSHPTQRRLVVAMVVTLACLPLVVLDLLGSHDDGGSSEAAVVNTDVPESSLVVAVSPDEPTTTVAPPASTTSTTAAASTSTKKTTSTTTPKAPSSTKAKASPPTTTAPAPAPPKASGPVGWEVEFMACVRWRESRNSYTAVDPSGTFMGAYQIYQGGWDVQARSMGRSDLVGVPPHKAAPADQDALALAMLRDLGTYPWGGTCG